MSSAVLSRLAPTTPSASRTGPRSSSGRIRAVWWVVYSFSGLKGAPGNDNCRRHGRRAIHRLRATVSGQSRRAPLACMISSMWYPAALEATRQSTRLTSMDALCIVMRSRSGTVSPMDRLIMSATRRYTTCGATMLVNVRIYKKCMWVTQLRSAHRHTVSPHGNLMDPHHVRHLQAHHSNSATQLAEGEETASRSG